MTSADDPIHLAAADWHAASDSDDFDWDGFTAWLEADPRHSIAYDHVALTDAAVRDHTKDPGVMWPGSDIGETVVVSAERRTRWPLWAGGAIAAALVAMVAVPRFVEPAPQVYATGAALRTLKLADGSTIVLAPRSRLEIAEQDQSRIRLAGGAWFDIRHDPARTLTIAVGNETISDIGTAFDVQNTPDGLRVAVTEGVLSVTSETLDRPLRLDAGRALALDRRSNTAQVRALAAGSAGEWRNGRLTYEQTPLPLVAGDLARYAGIGIAVDSSVADRRFSGTLIIGNGKEAARDLSQLMGLALVAGPDGYRLRQSSR